MQIDGFFAHNILIPNPLHPRFPGEHDITLLTPWAGYTFESKRSSFNFVKLRGNSPPEWMTHPPMMGRAKGKVHVFKDRENPLHIAWKKAQALKSQCHLADRK